MFSKSLIFRVNSLPLTPLLILHIVDSYMHFRCFSILNEEALSSTMKRFTLSLSL